jgi:hypothetical protein
MPAAQLSGVGVETELWTEAGTYGLFHATPEDRSDTEDYFARRGTVLWEEETPFARASLIRFDESEEVFLGRAAAAVTRGILWQARAAETDLLSRNALLLACGGVLGDLYGFAKDWEVPVPRRRCVMVAVPPATAKSWLGRFQPTGEIRPGQIYLVKNWPFRVDESFSSGKDRATKQVLPVLFLPPVATGLDR